VVGQAGSARDRAAPVGSVVSYVVKGRRRLGGGGDGSREAALGGALTGGFATARRGAG
jgi:hypothetical protein